MQWTSAVLDPDQGFWGSYGHLLGWHQLSLKVQLEGGLVGLRLATGRDDEAEHTAVHVPNSLSRDNVVIFRDRLQPNAAPDACSANQKSQQGTKSAVFTVYCSLFADRLLPYSPASIYLPTNLQRRLQRRCHANRTKHDRIWRSWAADFNRFSSTWRIASSKLS